MRKRSLLGGVSLGVVSAALLALPASGTSPSAGSPITAAVTSAGPFRAADDSYLATENKTLAAKASVLGNDAGVTALVAHTQPAHGTVSLKSDGTFTYTPAAGFTGVDTFTYSVSDAVKLFTTSVPPLGTIGGVTISGAGWGSSMTAVPGSTDEIYGLTDRGPNVDGPNGTKIEPLPDFTPSIGKFKLTVNGKAQLEKVIDLRAADGTPYNGRVNNQASTGETITDLDGNVLATSPYGYDSEGLVALPDGTFWVSDEYGPFITHFAADGRQIGRLSPFDGSLPAELANRVPNKGMEGLTITPDGSTLVGMMQSALQQPDLTSKPANVAPLRIVTYNLKTHVTHEYLYLLDDPKTNSGAVSEITALSNTQFVVDERDGKFEPGAYKRLFRIDIASATDVGPLASVPGATYDAARGGLLIGAPGQTIEAYTGTAGTAAAAQALAAAHITVGVKSPFLDLGGLLTTLDPTGGFFGHDKIEGVATRNAGRYVVVSNDSDFGIDGVTNTAPPFMLHAKTLPNGQQDDGEYLGIDMTKVADPVRTATVSIFVTPPDIHK